MKKIIALFIASASLLTFVSCGDSQTDTTASESTATTETTTESTTTDTAATETTTETTAAETTTVHTWNYPEPIEPAKWDNTKDEYFVTEQGENEFESFYQFYPELSIEEEFNTVIKGRIGTAEGYEEMEPGCEPIFIIFRVVAKEFRPESLNPPDIPGLENPAVVPLTYYYFQIVDVYGNITYDPARTYRTCLQSSTTRQLYGDPDLRIGEIYARIVCGDIDGYQRALDKGEFVAGFPVFYIREIDSKRYAYSAIKDLSGMECAIPITDPEENKLYKVGKHDKQIAELERLGLPMPTFNYKCELDALYMEYENDLKEIRGE